MSVTVFGFGVSDTEMLDTFGRPINARETVGGVTISAEAVIGDDSHLAGRYRIEFEKGREVPRTIEELHYGYHELTVRAMQGGRLAHSEFHDENLGDNAIVVFSDLRDGREVVAPGLWDMRFEINYPENGRTLNIDGSTGIT
ncbi:hypothetical protein [Corynebacterium cystitidis]|uniref:hypothetical protein n=1 Tax=Corynebacterium cystitidis TaxID=35757 RepID=UPI00211E2BE4|nr:hypothetical protein [Corynebacterium cystitidis]